MRRLTLALLFLAAMAATSVAQPSLTPISDPETPPEPTAAAVATQKSEGLATGLSIGTTFGGLAMIVVGASVRSGAIETIGGAAVFVGPSAGHIYAGENGHAVGMTLLRSAGAATFLYGLITDTVVAEGPREYSQHPSARPLMVLGAAAFLGGTLYDMFDAHRAVRRANAETGIVVAPLINAQTAGVAVTGRF
jgi:hypothetical protein